MFDQDEMDYCRLLVATRGDSKVGKHPTVVASYLRLQAASAFRAGDYEAAARLGHAATQINWSADNAHGPNWEAAELALATVRSWRVAVGSSTDLWRKGEAKRAAWRKEHGE